MSDKSSGEGDLTPYFCRSVTFPPFFHPKGEESDDDDDDDTDNDDPGSDPDFAGSHRIVGGRFVGFSSLPSDNDLCSRPGRRRKDPAVSVINHSTTFS